MENLNRELEVLINDFKDCSIDLTRAMDRFEVLLDNYIDLRASKITDTQKIAIKKALLTTLLKIKGLRELENKILIYREDNQELRLLLGLS